MPNEFYTSHPEANRTLRMDTGGLCQLCARKAARRVELHSPLWQAGPIMYGECCLPLAEAALKGSRPAAPEQNTPVLAMGRPAGSSPAAWLSAVAAAGIAALAVCLERLHVWLPRLF